MASSINTAWPVAGNASTANVRQNFTAAKSEIEALQTDKANLASPTFTGTATFATLNTVTFQIGGVSLTATPAVLNGLNARVTALESPFGSVQSTGFTAQPNKTYACNTSGGAFTATLPASPSVGDKVTFSDSTGSFSSNNLTIGRNGQNILGSASNLTVDVDWVSVSLMYVDASSGWIFV